MSVSSQITRIKDAKAAIKTAIAAKGVTVPDGAMLDDYAALIGNISGGGGETGVVASGECGEYVTWELYNTGELIISGAGAMYELSNSSDSQFYSYRDNITSIVIEYGVTTIESKTFFQYKQLKSVTIADSVTKIGNQAFAHCSSLTNVTIGKGVTTIDYGAFIDCGSLVSITIGKGVTTIVTQAFDECTNLLDVYYEGTKAEWDSISIAVRNDNLKNATLHCEYVEGGSSGGTGGGIIEVPELPTENIVENAIYKVVVDEESTFYIIRNGAIIDEKTFIQSLGLKEIYKYFVDELPADMLETDTTTGTACGYVINSTGVGYLKIKGVGVILTFGAVAFSNTGYDKGYTTDITLETQDGVYVQKGKHSEDWFYRESGEWVRITPEQENKQITLATPLRTTITPEEGKVFSSVTVDVGFKSIGDFIDRYITIDKITENDLTKTDGRTLTYIREYAFAYAKVKSIVFPSTVIGFDQYSFINAEVEEVTLKNRPNNFGSSIFSTCANLRTINVSWGNGEVSGAPWGATNATINYNYTGE